MAIVITALPSELEDAIKQSMEAVNNACLEMRQRGFTVLLPASLDFEVTISNDANAGTDVKEGSDTSGTVTGTPSTTTSTVTSAESTQLVDKTGGNSTSVTTPSGVAGTSNTIITHPQVITTSGGGDSQSEEMTQEWIEKVDGT